MFKFVVLCVIIWCDVSEISGDTGNLSTDTPMPVFPWMIPTKINDTDKSVGSTGNYNFHAAHQIIYLNAPYGWKNPSRSISGEIGEVIRSDYTVTNGIGAHKLHRRKVSWNKARKTCTEEGGHLAIIRTESEHKIILQMMREKTIDYVWVGFHDQFEEGDWVTVLDEPMAEIGWTAWSTALNPNPDNAGGTEHCGVILGKQGGLNDYSCTALLSFACKISIS